MGFRHHQQALKHAVAEHPGNFQLASGGGLSSGNSHNAADPQMHTVHEGIHVAQDRNAPLRQLRSQQFPWTGSGGVRKGEPVFIDELLQHIIWNPNDCGQSGLIQIQTTGVLTRLHAKRGHVELAQCLHNLPVGQIESQFALTFSGVEIVQQGEVRLGHKRIAAVPGARFWRLLCRILSSGSNGHDDESRRGDQAGGAQAASSISRGVANGESSPR